MKKIIAAMLLVLLAAPAVHAENPLSFGPSPLSLIRPSTGNGTAACPQPVIGSVQRACHFTNPFTHKTEYKSTVYNPTLGTFGTQKFRR